MNILETTKEIYRAFGKGDVAFMLSKFSDDVVLEPWVTTAVESGKVPYYKARRGKAGAKEFYASMSAVELKDFKVNGFMQGDNRVCVLVTIEFTVKASGIAVRDEELHLWTFDDQGQVIALQHFGDTAKHMEANTTK
jgi:ketosteroid isomerase-like protein